MARNFEWADLQQVEVIVQSCRVFICQFFKHPEDEDFVILAEM